MLLPHSGRGTAVTSVPHWPVSIPMTKITQQKLRVALTKALALCPLRYLTRVLPFNLPPSPQAEPGTTAELKGLPDRSCSAASSLSVQMP